MGCCFCCLSEEDKVGRVLEKFTAAPVKAAQDGMLQKLVGRVVLAGTMPFVAPGSGRPCVWYRVRVEEELVRMREERDDDGTVRMVRQLYWKQIARAERFQDFYLQDGQSKMFVNGAARGTCRIQSTNTGGRSNIFQQPPPGIQMLIAQSLSGFRGWGAFEGRTGRFRYQEEAFHVNELVAALGLVSAGVNPWTRQPVKILTPFNSTTLTEEFFVKNEWSDWDKRSWADLTKTPCVLLSDHPSFTGGVMVDPAVNLPPWMINPAAPTAAMYAPGYGATPAMAAAAAAGAMAGAGVGMAAGGAVMTTGGRY